MKGIDVSRWQGIIDWDAVKNAGTQFAMIKLGGSDNGLYPDGQGVRNANEARRVGLPHGFYFYLGGVQSSADEVQHIKNLIASIGGLQPGECLALDWEEHNTVEVQYVYEIAKGLIDAGFPAPLIYMSLSRVRGNDWGHLVDLNCGLWVAAWGNNDTIPDQAEVPGSDEWPFWAIWQYSSTGSVPGISGRVDLDQFNGDAAQFQKYGAGSTPITPVPAPPAPTPPAPTPAPPTPQQVEYTVQSGDNLSAIGTRYGVSWQVIWDLNRDRVSNPDRIFPGQKLRVPGGVAPAPAPKTYTVRRGDSLSAIAARLGINSWQTLYALNRDIIGPNANLIKPGQVLRLP